MNRNLVKIKHITDINLQALFVENKTKEYGVVVENIAKSRIGEIYAIINNFYQTNLTRDLVDEYISENIKAAKAIDCSSFLADVESTQIELSKLDEAVGILLFEKQRPSNLHEYISAKKLVKEHLLQEELSREKIEKLEQKIDSQHQRLSEHEISLAKKMLREESSAIFNELIQDTIAAIDQLKDSETDADTKCSLLEAKIKLMQERFDSEKPTEQLVRINDLKQSLLG